MTGQDLLESMEYVDPKLIEAAENPPRRKSYRKVYLMTGAAAACAAIVIGITAYSMNVRYAESTEEAVMMTAEAPEYEEAEEALEEMPEVEMDMAEGTANSGMDTANNPDGGAAASVDARFSEEAAADSADMEEKEEMAAVESAEMNPDALDEVTITMLDEELKVKAEPDKTIKEISFVMKEGSPTICVTITEEQADLLDQDELLSDSFDGNLTQYAAYIDERLSEYGFDEEVKGIVYIEGQTEPYRYFSADKATSQ